MEQAPPPRHVWSNVFIWADGLSEGETHFSSIENMRAGFTCEEEDALYRVRLLRVGPDPVVYQKVWWDEKQSDDTVYRERPEMSPDTEYIVNPLHFGDLYPSKSLVGLEGDWYYVDWKWRDALEPKISYKVYPQDTYPLDLFERLVKQPDPPYTEWNNVSRDSNVQFETLVKLQGHKQDHEVDDHRLCPHNRVKVDIEIKQNPDATWLMYVVEHYFVEA